jgi:hypothetical protein
MQICKEPKEVDLVVELTKRTKEDIEIVSKAIAHYKATGEKLSLLHPELKTSKTKKELFMKP